MNKKQIVLATLLAVSMSAVHAEEKTTFVKVKEMAQKVVTHPATKITTGAALIASTALVLIVGSKRVLPSFKMSYTDIAQVAGSSGADDPTTSDKVCHGLWAAGAHLPYAATFILGAGLIGSGIMDIVTQRAKDKNVQTETN